MDVLVLLNRDSILSFFSFFREQELSNLIHNKKFLKAIGLAITLEQPFRLLTILKGRHCPVYT